MSHLNLEQETELKKMMNHGECIASVIKLILKIQ